MEKWREGEGAALKGQIAQIWTLCSCAGMEEDREVGAEQGRERKEDQAKYGGEGRGEVGDPAKRRDGCSPKFC